MIPTTELQRAIRWREGMGLTTTTLAPHLGLGRLVIDYYEKGTFPPKAGVYKPLTPKIWHRYKMLCSGLDATARGRAKGKQFNWGE